MAKHYWDQHTGPHLKRKKKPPAARRRCHMCQGSGLSACRICSGKGEVLMGRDYNGRARFIRCEGCYGKKIVRCTTCNGTGWV